MDLTSVRDRIREVFLLRRAEEKSTALTNAQRTAMRVYHDAANRRLHVARDVRGPSQTPIALELYRQGGIFSALAFLVSMDPTLDPGSLTPAMVLDRLASTLEERHIAAPPEFERVKELFVTSDPLGLDRLSEEEAERSAENLDRTTLWLGTLYDARSPRDVRTARVLRVALGVAAVLALLVWLGAWILEPKNIAKRKRATASSTMGETIPAGAVDGSTGGAFDFHSALEEQPWLAIDLERPYVITRAKIYGRRDAPYDQSIPLALEVSDDGATFRQVAVRSEPFSDSDPWVVAPNAVVTRYLRLRTLKHSYLVVNEVEVNGHIPR
jgi:hypothetical protein